MRTMKETALEYIKGKGWEFKRQAEQLILRECPFCHDAKYIFVEVFRCLSKTF